MKRIHLVGFGSQGMAWATGLRSAGWDVQVFLSRKGKGFDAAAAEGFNPQLLGEDRLAKSSPRLVALLVPDAEIGATYQTHLAHYPEPLSIIIGHGYAVYAGDLKPHGPQHQAALFAPKAIGPQVTKKIEAARLTTPATHDLIAAVQFPTRDESLLLTMATDLCFANENLISVSFEQETIGDLISEQGLLCGGLFTLFEWTLEAMIRSSNKANLPPKLLRAECLTELGLIVNQMIDKGPSACFQKISQAAQCGSTMTKQWLESSGAKQAFERQVDTIVNGGFARQMKNPEWRAERDAWVKKMKALEEYL